jgi:5-methylcytosine-specific restriction endonuclease McrA
VTSWAVFTILAALILAPGWVRWRRVQVHGGRIATAAQRRVLWRRQAGLCATCGEPLPRRGAEADHIVPWSEGGRTALANLRLLHPSCHDQVTAEQAALYGWWRR